jgi:hypothetical protein
MNDMALDRVYARSRFNERMFGTSESRQSSAFYGYSLTTLAVGIGWLLRDYGLINPEEGLGYWLGIAGGSMMLMLLLYPLRKRIKLLRFLGSTQKWFRAHMILGMLGPLLVLYHSNFQLGSFNSRVALYCMLLVAGSGIVGRHIYAHIHRGLYGRKSSLTELRADLTKSLENSHGLATLLPALTAKLETLATEVQGCAVTGTMDTGTSLKWTFKQYSVWFSLWVTARRELKARAGESTMVARDYRRLRKASSAYVRRFVRLTGRVAQFTLYEKMFSLWHVLHMPFFFMMVISALLHVLAVHMY